MKNAVKEPPTLLETAAYGLFFAGTLVGPQFPLNRFRAFINQKMDFIERGEVKESRYL